MTFKLKTRSKALVVLFLSFWTFSQILAQCDNIDAISFTPSDTVICGFPTTIDFHSNVSVNSTPVLLSTASSSPSFQSSFNHNFSTNNNVCYYFLEMSGMFTVWLNTPSYFDGYSNFNVSTNQFISQGIINIFSYTPPLYLSPNSYNPNHVYQYYYLGDGSTINVNFSDNLYIDNSGSMTFKWYAIPCFEYLWDFGDNTSSNELNPTHTYTNPGIYQVTLTVTDLYNACSDNITTTITVNPVPTVDLGVDTIICYNETLNLNATFPNAAYLWQNGSSNPTLNVTQSEMYWVDVSVQGCTTRDSINVTVLNNNVNDISTTICLGDTITIGNNNYTTSGFYTNNFTTNQGCDSIINLDLTVIATNAVINVPLALDCDNATIFLDGNGSTIGPNISYSWSTQGGNIINGDDTLNPEIDRAGLYQLNVIYNDGALFCSAFDTITVFENFDSPIANAGNNQTLNCFATILTLDGSNSSTAPEFNYSWSSFDGNIVSGNKTLNPLIDQQGIYTLVITNEENGCTASDSVEIMEEIISIDDFILISESPTCFGNDGMIEIQLASGNNPFFYSIDSGAIYYPSPIFNSLDAGDYFISIIDTFYCEANQTFYLPNSLKLSIQLEPEVNIQYGESYNLQAIANIPLDSIASIKWEPAAGLSCDQCPDPVASPTETTIYTVTYVDNIGCQAQAQVVITVTVSRNVFIPNSFSPINGDGNNDLFRIYTPQHQVKKVNSFKIFSRWGELIYKVNAFQPNDPTISWDGTFKGKMLQPGVFVYSIEIEFIDGKIINYKGDVTIIN